MCSRRASTGLGIALAFSGWSACATPHLAPSPEPALAPRPAPPGGEQQRERRRERPAVGLRLVVHPDDAALQVNDRAYGPVSTALGPRGLLALEPGVYRIVLTRPGFQTWRAEVAVDSQLEPIHVTLNAVE